MDDYLSLSNNGLLVSTRFPVKAYETAHSIISTKRSGHHLYGHYGGAWNALAYRYRACLDAGIQFNDLLKKHGSSPPPLERYFQERTIFEFFSNGFSCFESAFYGLYAFGAMINEPAFPLSSEQDQQRVTPTRTKESFTKAFPGDVITSTLSSILLDQGYRKWREIRNVLTHRTAPGRRIYASIGEDEPPTEWKLNGSPLDDSIVLTNGVELDRLLGLLLESSAAFVTAKFS